MATTPKNSPTTTATPATPDGPAPASQTADADRVKALEAEVKRLREQLAATGNAATPARRTEPSFTFTEGQRAELAATGRTVSPFTGKRYVGTGVGDAREATLEEFNAAKPPAAGN